LTSNLGSDILAHPSACNPETGVINPEAKSEVLERTSEYFPPELLNRLDSMLVFNKLSRNSILKVVSLRLDDVSNRLKNRRITLDVDETAREWLAKHGYSETYGARAIARVVRTDLLFPLAQKLLKGTIRSVFSVCFLDTVCSQGWKKNRDGDVVKIRVAGDVLDIQENHLPDPTIVRADSHVEPEEKLHFDAEEGADIN
jgi:ATP-dependent Clp protease ATP-binding subunit ClpB